MAPRKENGKVATKKPIVAKAKPASSPTEGDQSALAEEPASVTTAVEREEEASNREVTQAAGSHRPLLPPGISESFVPVREVIRANAGETLLYRPAFLGKAQVHFVDKKAGVDTWQDVTLLRVIDDGSMPDDVWEGSQVFVDGEDPLELEKEPEEGATFGELPTEMNRAKRYADEAKSLKNYLYRERTLSLWSCTELDATSNPGESEKEFRLRLTQASREERDRRIDALRAKYAPKFQALEKKRAQARQRLELEQAQATKSTLDAVVTAGTSFLKYWMSKKSISSTNLGRATSAAKAAERAYKQRGDVGSTSESLDQINQQLLDLDEEFKHEVEMTKIALSPESFALEEFPIRARKGDLSVDKVILAWTPWKIGSEGKAEAAY